MLANNKRKTALCLTVILVASVRSIWKSSQLLLPETFEEANPVNQTNEVARGQSVSRRVVWLPNTNHSRIPRGTRQILPMSTTSPSRQDPESAARAFERAWFFHCHPTKDIPVRPTCNSLHEIDSFGVPNNYSGVSLLSMEGSWRSVWKVEPGPVILKLLQLHRAFNAETFQSHAMDSIVMERLTVSPHVVNSFGYCGQSVITEFAISSGRHVIKDPKLPSSQRLRLGRDLARGLAELHSLQPIDFGKISHSKNISKSTLPPGPAIFAHYDINPANTVSIRAKSIQWNDFNLGIQSKEADHRENKNTASCRVPIRYGGDLWRSPEELRNDTGFLDEMQSSDVYSFGNILFTVLTKHQPWTHLEDVQRNASEVAARRIRGKLPQLPEKYQPHTAEGKVLWQATKACFRRDPLTRPSSFQLAVALGRAEELIKQKGSLSTTTIEQLFQPV